MLCINCNQFRRLIILAGMGRYVNPLADFAFKKLFGSESGKESLISFLNSILPQKHQIEDVEYRPTEARGGSEFERSMYFDLRCRATNGQEIIVEVQKSYNQWFTDRMLYYSTFPIQEQVKRETKTNYIKLNPVYLIGVLNFAFPSAKGEEKQVVQHIRPVDIRTGEEHSDKWNLMYVQLENFEKREEELESVQDRWLYVLKHLPELDKLPEKLQDRVFEHFFQLAEISNFSAEEKNTYEMSLLSLADGEALMMTAKNEGKEEGKLQALIETASRMLSKGFSVEDVSDLTGLSIEEMTALSKEL